MKKINFFSFLLFLLTQNNTQLYSSYNQNQSNFSSAATTIVQPAPQKKTYDDLEKDLFPKITDYFAQKAKEDAQIQFQADLQTGNQPIPNLNVYNHLRRFNIQCLIYNENQRTIDLSPIGENINDFKYFQRLIKSHLHNQKNVYNDDFLFHLNEMRQKYYLNKIKKETEKKALKALTEKKALKVLTIATQKAQTMGMNNELFTIDDIFNHCHDQKCWMDQSILDSYLQKTQNDPDTFLEVLQKAYNSGKADTAQRKKTQ